jgi:hypothetical protein
MSAAKFTFTCPECKQSASYTPKTLEKGVCRNKACKHTFTPEEKAVITRGLEEKQDDRKFEQVKAKV